MPARGTVITEEQRERYRQAARSRKSQLVRLNIVSEEEYNRCTKLGLIWCGDCKQFLSPELFGNDKRKNRCKPCGRKRNVDHYNRNPEALCARRMKYYRDNHPSELRKAKAYVLSRYGADQKWYDEKLAEQNGGCAICGSPTSSRGRKFAVDHNHSCCTKQKTACNNCRRGLLCDRCNHSLERLESHPHWLESAVAYLRKYGSLA